MNQRKMTVAGHTITDTSRPFTIAEIGHNHQGSIEICEQLIDAAIASGASAGKIQKRNNREIFTEAFYDSVYTSPNAYAPTYGAHREALEFSRVQVEHLISYARARNFVLFSTAFDETSADLLAEAGVEAIKIASGDLTNTPLLRHVAHLGLPMVVSTGGGTMMDVRRAYDTVMPINEHLCLLQCTANYPPSPQEINLNVITTFRNTFQDVVIGLSDHTLDDTTALAAVALGARVVEKHFTMSRDMKGSDHGLSFDPAMMKAMVDRFTMLTEAMGDGIKRRYPGEERGLKKMAKALVARRPLPAGHIIQPEDLCAKTPPEGCPPYEKEIFLGRRLKSALEVDEAISDAHIEHSSVRRLFPPKTATISPDSQQAQ